MAIRAYDEDYVMSAQRVLGDMLDFAVYSLEWEADVFWEMFLVSGVAEQFQRGNPAYVAGRNGCELAREVLLRSGLPEPEHSDEMYLDKSPEYWAGWAMAYYQWYTGRSFSRIYRAVKIRELLCMYPIFHEADIMKLVEALDEKYGRFYIETNLKRLRKNAGLSQRGLAEMAGVPIRQIQLFEQRRRDINKAQALSLLKLGKGLGCSIEELLEI